MTDNIRIATEIKLDPASWGASCPVSSPAPRHKTDHCRRGNYPALRRGTQALLIELARHSGRREVHS
jgi:hypothetical protein